MISRVYLKLLLFGIVLVLTGACSDGNGDSSGSEGSREPCMDESSISTSAGTFNLSVNGGCFNESAAIPASDLPITGSCVPFIGEAFLLEIDPTESMPMDEAVIDIIFPDGIPEDIEILACFSSACAKITNVESILTKEVLEGELESIEIVAIDGADIDKDVEINEEILLNIALADSPCNLSDGETSGSTSGSTSGGTSGTTGGTSGSTSGSTSGDTSGTTSGDTSGGTSGDTSGSTGGDTSGSTSGDTSGGTSGDTSGSTSGDTSGTTSGDTSGSTGGGTSGGITDICPQTDIELTESELNAIIEDAQVTIPLLETAISLVQVAIATLESFVDIDGVNELIDLLQSILTASVNLLSSLEELVSVDATIEQQCSIAASVCADTQNLVNLIDQLPDTVDAIDLSLTGIPLLDNLVNSLIDVLTDTVDPLVEFLIDTLKPALESLNVSSCVSVDVN